MTSPHLRPLARSRTLGRALVLVCAWMLSALASTAQAQSTSARPENVVLLISDGCGPASFTLARTALGRPLALDAIRLGNCTTGSADSLVTDSAAAATALASGHKTLNGAVGMDPAGRPLATLLEAAEDHGLATGLVTTTWVSHATPACFAAHVPDRIEADEIAGQLLAHHIEVLFGGGSWHFLPEGQGGGRGDGRNLVAEAARLGVTAVHDRSGLSGPLELPVLGLFAEGHLAYEVDRDPQLQPSLAEMAARALELLATREQGFLLMIEGGRIDHAGHENDPIAHLHEIEAFDETVARVLAFAREQGATLVVSTSDHETGGLSLSRDIDGLPLGDWRPAALTRAASSAGAMADRILAGEDPVQVLSRGAAIEDLSADELEALDDDGGFFSFGPDRAAVVAAVCAVVNLRAGLSWSTTGHTAVDVPLFAFGPGADRFAGQLDNTEVCSRIAGLMRFDLAELTERLRAGETPWLD